MQKERGRDRKQPSRDQCCPDRCSQVRMPKIPNTEAIAITLQKICNGFPLILKILTERYGLFTSPSNGRHTRPGGSRILLQCKPAGVCETPSFPTPKGSCDLEPRAPVFLRTRRPNFGAPSLAEGVLPERAYASA